ncbi:hypothetical protein M3Y95_00087600 [Aphelenchoides besseyi]|nr:hypothetical protein M3Y95_00087600 [Aphelenchoides besseyi]
MVGAGHNSSNSSNSSLQVDDVLVFLALESLGTLAITGNLCLITVLLKNKYLNRASFILMLSLAIADVVHGIVTTSFFYPPILLKRNHMPPEGVRVFNILDWTAWSITLTHMSAICLDRLIAIMLYGRYSTIVTVQRMRFFTIACWVTFFTVNTIYIAMKVCCLIAPLQNNDFYTFGYGEFETEEDKQKSIFGPMNLFTFTYSPLELTTLAILSISNPITLIQLYRRHKRKVALRIQSRPRAQPANALKTRSQWQRASTMLLEMSMRMGSKHINNDVRELASRRANRQQQRILLQISVVAVIFYLYMTTYYMVYHVFEIQNKWVVLFNSFFYSITHSINPCIYFSLNKEMRAQLMKALTDFLSAVCCINLSSAESDSQRKPSTEARSSTKGVENSVTITETSPLFSTAVNNNRSIAVTVPNASVERLKTGEFSASLKRLINHNSSSTTPPIRVDSITEEVTNETAAASSIEPQNNFTHNHDTQSEMNISIGLSQTSLCLKTNHMNNGFLESSDKLHSSSSRESTSENENNTQLSTKEHQSSFLESILQAMKRVAASENFSRLSFSVNSSQSKSLELPDYQPVMPRRLRMSRTIHGITEYTMLPNGQPFRSPHSCSFNASTSTLSGGRSSERQSGSSDRLIRESLVMLIDEANTTISTVTDADCPVGCETYDLTPDEDIIFL